MDPEWLRHRQNSDGGWGYAPEKKSSLEPTALALLALLAQSAEDPAVARACAWIRARQVADGSFAAQDGADGGSWAGSLAILALARAKAEPEARRRAVAWLRGTSGETYVGDRSENDLDGTLRGWCWMKGTFSWVEPTSYAVMALKVEGHGDDPRVEEAERMLLDRMCADGGWNYGNRRVLGEELVSFDQVTAKVAVALQDRAGRPELARTAAKLADADLRGYHSTITRAWIALARGASGRPPTDADRAAVAENVEADLDLGTATLAVALARIVAGWDSYRPFVLTQ